ncbi:MAG: SH3 domain-containing protein [Spirochaetia bacterium]|nr:SH3 domain-containing protein [Spirochaetia bacterium]
MNKWLWSLILFLSILFHFECGEKNAKNMFINAENGLILRTSPSLKGEKITVIPDKMKIFVLEEKTKNINISGKEGKWTKVLYNNTEGWVFGGFLISSLKEEIESEAKTKKNIKRSKKELPIKINEKNYNYMDKEYQAVRYKNILLLERNDELLDPEHSVTDGYKYSVFLFLINDSGILMPYFDKFSEPIGDSDGNSTESDLVLPGMELYESICWGKFDQNLLIFECRLMTNGKEFISYYTFEESGKIKFLKEEEMKED